MGFKLAIVQWPILSLNYYTTSHFSPHFSRMQTKAFIIRLTFDEYIAASVHMNSESFSLFLSLLISLFYYKSLFLSFCSAWGFVVFESKAFQLLLY